ncbi:AlpA family transcriptional regulator [Pseudomonas sp. AU11447]|uniref:helix-turn-helix transcriptional regulator n=1 Tax=unclassified Pseudomonas TaxID=196821 RepID=UPI0006D3BA95|nr:MULTISPECIES: AlpA family phage regulatory protein [unclassified Pseudomonas]OBY88838.1 AlpA family transcriptional regulator [Pseudomonas sp. AU11447]
MEKYKILRLKQVSALIGLSRSTIYDRMNPLSPRYDEKFPRPIKIGKSAVGWLESSLNEWIELMVKKSQEGGMVV